MNIFLNLLSYSVVTGSVFFVLTFLQNRVERIYTGTQGEHIIKITGYAVAFRIVAVVIFVFFLGLSRIEMDGQGTLFLFGLIVSTIFFLLSIMHSIWNITVTDDSIIYCNFFGRKKVMNYSDISKTFLDEYGRLVIYIEDKKVFTLNEKLDHRYIIKKLKEHGFPTKAQYTTSSFSIELSKFDKKLDILVSIMGIGLFLLCLIVGHLVGTFLCGILAFVSIYCIPAHRGYKIVIQKSNIFVKRFLRKTKEYTFKDVDYITTTNTNNLKHIHIHMKDRFTIKYSVRHKNAKIFDKIISQQKWQKR